MTLRQAAEAVRTVWSEGWSSDSGPMAAAMCELENALSEPDPLAEAEEIMRQMLELLMLEYVTWQETEEAATKARDWLAKREAK